MSAVRDDAIVVFDDAQALAHGVAERIVASARAAIRERGSFALALAGGSTPKAAYALLGGATPRAAIDWSRVRFFFGDERCVPPDADDSNYNMARQGLLDPLEISAESVFRMHGESEPATAARGYADVLRAELGPEPVLDLIMLGMGPDGHTASLFPGNDPTTDERALVRAVWVDKLAAHRLTVTPRVINAARHVLIATEGTAKAEALAAVLEGPHDPVALPIQIVAPGERLVWLVDRAATARLRSKA